MEVILVKPSEVGAKGSVKNVKTGFFRNYLHPRGIAVMATRGLREVWVKKSKEDMIQKEELVKSAMAVKERLEGKSFSIAKKANPKGTLYSAITPEDVAKALKDQAKIEVDAAHLVLKSHLKKVGTFEIPLQLAEGVEVKISLEIQATEGGKK